MRAMKFDRIGLQQGIAVFLSETHGLVAVDTRGPIPEPSCAATNWMP